MSESPNAALVERIVDAYTQIAGGPGQLAVDPAPIELPDEFRSLSEQEAYDFQEALVAALLSTYGGERRGYKIGGADPFYGVLLDSHVLGADDVIPLATANKPVFEPEILVRTSRELSAETTREELAASVEIAGGIEMPVSRFANWSLGFPRTALIADNALSTYVVLGSTWRQAPEESTTISVSLTHDAGSGAQEVAAGSRTIGSVYDGLTWLLGALASRGATLAAGSVIATGTLLKDPPAIPMSAGTYVATFDNDLASASITAK